MLVEDASYSEGRDTGADKDKIMNITNPSTNEFIYAFGSFSATGKLSTLATNKLEGAPLGIQGNTTDAEYTISFPNVILKEGRDALYLEDMLLDSIAEISTSNPYTFTIENSQKGKAIDNRFRIYKPFTPDAGELAVCVYFDNIEITNNPYTTDIVVKDAEGNVVLTKAPRATPQVISLENLASGHYFLEIGTESFEFYNKPEAK